MPDQASRQTHDATSTGIVPPWDEAPDTAEDLPLHDPTRMPHPGWSAVPDEAFALGQSGGWGGPDHTLTGPIPIIRGHEVDSDQPTERVDD